jgi:hypothetical protein
MTVAVICVTVAAVAFLGAARHLWRASEFGDAAATVLLSVGVWLSVLGCLLLRHLVPAAPLWMFVVVALSGVPVASAPILVADLRWRPPTIAAPEPVGACQRCGNQLWDRDGNPPLHRPRPRLPVPTRALATRTASTPPTRTSRRGRGRPLGPAHSGLNRPGTAAPVGETR